ncbi:MAG: hypothetical protein QOH04_2617 [Sphingomonadales bacterium]|jgi:hypothetical protein|nr:hypothetical protein [Sphingomonadales bacterium]
MSRIDPAEIIADLLASTLMPRDGTWASARQPYAWELDGLRYLELRKLAGDRPPINDWTAMLVDEGYPAAKAGARQGSFWRPEGS